MEIHLQEYDITAQRISAIYAANLADTEINQYYKKSLNKEQFFMPLKPAEIGCFMSHLKALEAFVQDSNKPYAVILEDDVEFVGNPSTYYPQWISALQTNQPRMLKLYARRRVSGRNLYQDKELETYLPRVIPLGTQAAVINREGAKCLLSCWRTFGMPVDVAYQHWWQHGVKVMVTVPNHILEISEQLGGSNISVSGKSDVLYKAKREIKRSWYRLVLSLKSRYYYWRDY